MWSFDIRCKQRSGAVFDKDARPALAARAYPRTALPLSPRGKIYFVYGFYTWRNDCQYWRRDSAGVVPLLKVVKTGRLRQEASCRCRNANANRSQQIDSPREIYVIDIKCALNCEIFISFTGKKCSCYGNETRDNKRIFRCFNPKFRCSNETFC